MKKLIISGVFCSVLMLGGFQVASAEETTTTTSNSATLAKIQELMKLIADLQAKLAEVRGEVQELTKDLSLGAQDDDVKKIQEILATDPTIFGAKPTGYFGPLTESAVKKFQERYGLEVTGKLDADTRELMKEFRKEIKSDKMVPPGLIKSQEVKDRIKMRLQTKWGDCDFGEKFRASDCKKGHGDKDRDDDEDDDSNDDNSSATRQEAVASIMDASDAVAAFADDVNEMEDDNVDEDKLEDAQDTLADARKKLADARRALVKKEFGDAVEKAEKVIDILEDTDDSDDDNDDDSDHDSNDDDDKDDEDGD